VRSPDRVAPASLALALLAGLMLFVVSAWAEWALGAPMNGAPALALACGGVTWLLRATGHGLWTALRATGFLLLMAALAGVLGETVHDLSSDGQLYHQQAVLLMSQGWNPLHQPESTIDNWSKLWVDGYAKTHWVYAALLTTLGFGIEAGKSFTWLLGLAGGLLAYALLTERLAWSRRSAAAVSALAVLNPVFATEWPTYMNDHTLACMLMLLLLSLFWAARAPALPAARRQAAALVMCSVALLASVKASGVAYALVLLVLAAPLLVWACGMRAAVRLGAVAVAGLAFGVLVLGFNPYVTNTLGNGHPFHPLAGQAKVDIISNNVPAGVAEQTRLVKFFGSLAARSSSTLGGPVQPETLAPKLPGSVSVGELKVFLTKNDVRIAGFGPWFSLALVVAAVGAVWAGLRRQSTAGRRVLLLAPMALLMLSALAFPEPWWARYVPQVWLAPLAVAVALITSGRADGDRPQRVVGWSIVAIAAANAALVALLFVAGNLPRQLDYRTQLDSLKTLSNAAVLRVDVAHGPAQGRLFDDLGIRWQSAGMPAACPAGSAWVQIEYSHGRLCLDETQATVYVTQSPWVESVKRRLQGRQH